MPPVVSYLADKSDSLVLSFLLTFDPRALCPHLSKSEKESAHIANRRVLHPHGVWVMISPFYFPSAPSAGASSAAMIGGETGALKPAADTACTVLEVARCFLEEGLPDGRDIFLGILGMSGGK
jgi:acyl-CoA reductase-like NAD-dependent aldehyde dehydrogenase